MTNRWNNFHAARPFRAARNSREKNNANVAE
jgi:hypothetical protein